MAGLVPAIHVPHLRHSEEDVDPGIKPGMTKGMG
jgi:hypothetical protein